MNTLVPLVDSPAVTAIKDALTSLATDAPIVIAAALAVAVIGFGARYLWRLAKSMAK